MPPKKKMKFSQSGSNQSNSPDRRGATPMERLLPGGAAAPQCRTPGTESEEGELKKNPLRKSVCKVDIQDSITGSGFMLFDNFILTNYHLFKDCIEGQKLKEGVNVSATFNYEDSEPQTNHYYFQLAHPNIYSLSDLDYVIFEINPQGFRGRGEPVDVKVPPGLLKNFGPIRPNGKGYIIGHPGGNVKKMDPISIIEKENRDPSLGDINVELFRIYKINYGIKNYPHEDAIVTYNSTMYGGSSGSPVFDARDRVFGLHTGGLFFGSKKPDESVMEFAISLLRIFENFVTKLKDQVLLDRIKEEIKGNSHLKKVFRI